MDSGALSDEEYGPMKLDQMIQDELFDSSDLDEEVDMIMLMSMQAGMDRQVEHNLNFKGSIKGRRVINRDGVSGEKLLHKDYFAPKPTFPDDPWFHRCFRMRKPLFFRIVEGIEAHDDYLKLIKDCCGQSSFSAKQKCTAALRMLKAVASHDLCIWHVLFGMPAFHNDINVLQRSPVFRRLCNGESLRCNYTVNDRDYNMGYYLADGIYPQWSAFVKTISEPHGKKHNHFATMQEADRKDVERAFGVL